MRLGWDATVTPLRQSSYVLEASLRTDAFGPRSKAKGRRLKRRS